LEAETEFHQETEERVESRGKAVLNSLPLDFELVSSVAAYYAPKQEAASVRTDKAKTLISPFTK